MVVNEAVPASQKEARTCVEGVWSFEEPFPLASKNTGNINFSGLTPEYCGKRPPEQSEL